MINFRPGDQSLSTALASLGFSTREELLGLYVNSPTNPWANLIFTVRGVYIFEAEWVCLEYENIKVLSVLKEENFSKSTADTILLELDGEKEHRVLVSGGHGKFRDFWQVYTFLQRVMNDVRRYPQ